MILFFSFIYALLGVLNIYILIKQLKINGWGLFSYSLIYLIIFYNIIPIVSLLYINPTDKFSYLIPNFDFNYEVLFFSLVCVMLGFTAYYVGYFSTKIKGHNIEESITYKKTGYFFTKDILIFLIFISSILGFILYIRGFGSIENAILHSNFVRSGYYKNEDEFGDTSHTFFFRFIFLSLIPILYYYTLKEKKRYHKIILVISLCIIVTLYLFLSPGRQSVIDFVLIFIFSSLLKKRKVINNQLIALGVLSLIMLPLLEIFLSGNHNQFTDLDFNLKETIINEFGFPFYSLFYSIDKEYDYFFYSDFFTGIFGKILPSSLSPQIEQTNFLNTFFMTGDQGRGYVPPGIFAQGYYSMGIIGIIMLSGFSGWFFKKIDIYFNRLLYLEPRYSIFYSYFIVKSMVWIRTGLPANYFYNFTFLVFWMFLFLSFKIKIRAK